MCDGINHCADGSDETAGTLCQSQDKNTFLGFEMSWVVLIASCSSLVICSIIIGVTICICRRQPRFRIRTPNALQSMINEMIKTNCKHLIIYILSSFLVHQPIEINGSSKHLQGTLPRETTSIPSSGNLHRPAGLSGMSSIILAQIVI